MAGYKIINDNSKKNSILKMEGICPVCSHYPSSYFEIPINVMASEGKPKNARQFRYRCPKCDSVWDGNLYDNNLNLK